MERVQFSAIVKKSEQTMVQLLVDVAAQVAAVGKAQDGAGGVKFSGELRRRHVVGRDVVRPQNGGCSEAKEGGEQVKSPDDSHRPHH